MIQARIHQGRVEAQEPIPAAWEGQLIKLVPLRPEDPVRDVDHRLAVLHAMGPMEVELGGREAAKAAWAPKLGMRTRKWQAVNRIVRRLILALLVAGMGILAIFAVFVIFTLASEGANQWDDMHLLAAGAWMLVTVVAIGTLLRLLDHQ